MCFVLAPPLPRVAVAGPTSPVVEEPADDELGPIFFPGIRLTENLKEHYVEEEFLVSGAATIFTYENPPVRENPIPLEEDVPYKTRIVIIRPRVASHFNGTLVVEWLNSSAGFDTAPVWDSSAEYFAREGFVYVGYTNSSTSIENMVGGCQLVPILPPTCGTRYVTLSMPENGQAFEIGSQIANLLKSDSPDNPLPPKFQVERLYHAGTSQQGGSMVTYATGFHFPVNDGYFIQAASTARPINFGPACGEAGSPAYPDCTPRLEGEARLVRTDLQVPVVRAMTETDVPRVVFFGTRQTDSGNFRYYEMAGAAHVQVHKDVEAIPGLFLENFCLNPLNTTADGPVFGSYLYNAMWNNMERNVRLGEPMPQGDPLALAEFGIARDEHGNALGGLRLPQLEVPIAQYTGSNVVNPALPPALQGFAQLFCGLAGSTFDFDQATLDELYPSVRSYLQPFKEAAQALAAQGFLLKADAAKLVRGAHSSGVGR